MHVKSLNLHNKQEERQLAEKEVMRGIKKKKKGFKPKEKERQQRRRNNEEMETDQVVRKSVFRALHNLSDS